MAFIASFLLLVFLVWIAGVLHSEILVRLSPSLRAVSYVFLLVVIVSVWSIVTYKIFKVVERRGLNISQDKNYR
ncbi:MAG: hypothetical protein GXO10_04450 [Crenarchaeota archaeon]|nr:hypothetical protein [Thermoproteota archaeon]